MYRLTEEEKNYYRSLNNVVKDIYKGAFNFRLGGEVKFNIIMARLGFAYYGSPYKDGNWDASSTNVSAGIGYRAKNWFLDLAFVQSKRNFIENAYILTNGVSPRGVVTKNTSNALLTMCWKF